MGKGANQKLQTGLQTGAENACYHYILAIPAGFEPVTHGVEIRFGSNQINGLVAFTPWPGVDQQTLPAFPF